MDENGHTILPPGTVPLVEFEVATDDTRLILSPAPSNDPNEPLNWAPWRKYFNFLLIMAMTIAAFTSLQIQTVFWQQMSVDLNLRTSQLNNAQSGNLAGLAVGCIFFIPFTVKYGRRLVYILSICVLAAATWWTARIQSFAELMCTSVICGLAGAINETAVQMTIADMFFVHQRATANACYFASVMIGSFLAPIAGGAQAATQGWRWSYYALAIALTCVSFIFIFCYEETKYVPISNGQREGGPIQTSMDGEAPEKEKLPEGADLTIVASTAMAEPAPPLNTYRQRMRLITKTDESLWKLFVMPLSVITLPHVLFTALQFASAIAWLVLFMPAVSVIFSAPPYSFTTAGVGYMTLGPFVGNALGSLYGGPLSDWSAKWFAKRNGGLYEPEMRLYILPLPIACMASGLIMFGVTADKGMHWILPSVGGALFAFGMGAMGDITFTFTVDTYRELIAEAFVGVAFFRNAFSVAIPFSLVPWMTTMGVSNMFIIIGCLSLAIGLLFIPMIIWGKRIRTALTPRYYHLVDKHAHVS